MLFLPRDDHDYDCDGHDFDGVERELVRFHAAYHHSTETLLESVYSSTETCHFHAVLLLLLLLLLVVVVVVEVVTMMIMKEMMLAQQQAKQRCRLQSPRVL